MAHRHCLTCNRIGRSFGERSKQDSSIRVENLPQVGMGWRRLRLAEQRLVPVEADTARTPIIVHVRFMTPSCGLT